MATYYGFSSTGAGSSRNIRKTDLDLIKADLLNTFYTLPGENRMRPAFGCRLRQSVMEQDTNVEQSYIIAQVKAVVDSDPRVTYISTTITVIPLGITVAVQLTDVDSGTPFTLVANFNTDTSAIYGFSGN